MKNKVCAENHRVDLGDDRAKVKKPKGILTIDWDKTVAEAGVTLGETPNSARTLNALGRIIADSTKNQMVVAVSTGNSYESLDRRGYSILRKWLSTHDALDRMVNMPSYTATNIVKTTFNTQATPIHHHNYMPDVEVRPTKAYEIADYIQIAISAMAQYGINPLYNAYLDWLEFKNKSFLDHWGKDFYRRTPIKVVDNDTTIENYALVVINRYAPISSRYAHPRVIKITAKGLPSDGAYIMHEGQKITFRGFLHTLLEDRFGKDFQVLQAGAGSIDFNFRGIPEGKLLNIKDLQKDYHVRRNIFRHIGDEGRIKNKNGEEGNDLSPIYGGVPVFNTGLCKHRELLPAKYRHLVVEANQLSPDGLDSVAASADLLEHIANTGTLEGMTTFIINKYPGVKIEN